MSRVLVAGCGDVGGLLARALVEGGHDVAGLRRDPAQVPEGVEPIAGDLGRPETLRALPGPFDAVVYTATAGEGSDDAYRRVYVEGQRNLAEALGAAPRRWVFTSSTSVYAQRDGEWVDEDSPTEPTRFSGLRMLEAERLAARLGEVAVSVRFGGIYGEGRTWLVERVRAGARCVAEPPLYTNRIHREDCAGVLAHLLALERPAPCFLAVDGAPAPQCEVMDWIAGRLGLPAPEREAPGAPRASKRCRNDRLLASGYRLRFPSYREGYGRMLGSGPDRAPGSAA